MIMVHSRRSTTSIRKAVGSSGDTELRHVLGARRRPRRMQSASLAASIVIIALLSSCGADVTATTCDEFAAMSESKQNSTIKALLKAHDKEDGVIMGSSNRQILRSAIQSYCMISPITGNNLAHAHNSDPIDNAANWS